MLDHVHPKGGCCDCDDTAGTPALIDIDAARTLSLSQVAPIDVCATVSPAKAHGRVLARDILATTAMPAFDNSAMDGFAVRVSEFEVAQAKNDMSNIIDTYDKLCNMAETDLVPDFKIHSSRNLYDDRTLYL